jgi:hypothetical protein
MVWYIYIYIYVKPWQYFIGNILLENILLAIFYWKIFYWQYFIGKYCQYIGKSMMMWSLDIGKSMMRWSLDIGNYCNILPIFSIFLLAIFYCQGMIYIFYGI